jgi:hypothetical protein
VSSSIKVIVDGQEYNSLDELPPEARARYEQAIGALDANRNGLPDFLDGTMNSDRVSASTSSILSSQPRRYKSPKPEATPDTTNGLTIALAVLLLFILCAAGAAGVWYFILR